MSAGGQVIRIRLSGGYGFAHLDRLIRDLAPILEIRDPSQLHLDLSGLVFIGPTALALLVAALRTNEDREMVLGGLIVPPKAPQVRNYLMRMDFLRVLGDDQVAEPFKRREAIGFRPCRHFRTDEDYPLVAADLTAALAERCETEKVAEASIRICLDELTENVIHHADTPYGGFAAAQGWRKRQEFEIGIVDLGVGIRGSLTKNPAYADIEDDVSAIATALQPRVTATPDRNAGIGLFITKRLLRANGGVLVVRSGTGVVHSGAQTAMDQGDVRLPGTLVALRARTDRPLNINEIYDELDGADQGKDDD